MHSYRKKDKSNKVWKAFSKKNCAEGDKVSMGFGKHKCTNIYAGWKWGLLWRNVRLMFVFVRHIMVASLKVGTNTSMLKMGLNTKWLNMVAWVHLLDPEVSKFIKNLKSKRHLEIEYFLLYLSIFTYFTRLATCSISLCHITSLGSHI